MAGEGGEGENRPQSNLPVALQSQAAGFFDRITESIRASAGGPGTPQGQAAAAIQQGLDTATETIGAGVDTARADLDPFTQEGLAGLSGVSDLITDPNAQKDFIVDNPFFKALADDAERRIFNQAGAGGKRFAGGTAEALRNSILLLGPDLVNQNVNQRLDLAGLGLQSAGGQATASTSGAISLADLAARGGETQAAGILGLENTRRADDAASDASNAALLGTLGSAVIGLF